MKTLLFVVPEWTHATGGNLYNRHLVATLQDEGLSVDVLTDEEYRHASRIPEDALFILDSLYLAHVRSLPPGALLLLHYLPSLQPLRSEGERSQWRAMEDDACARAAGIIVTGEFSRKILWRRGINTPLYLIPPALCLEPDPRPRCHDGMHALMVANLTPAKGVRDFLQELAGQLRPDDDFTLQIVGREDFDPDYAASCREIACPQTTFLGEIGGNELAARYAAGNLFVSAACSESFGMALHEARAFGLPLLTLNGGNCPEHIVQNRNGCLVDSHPALAQTFLQLVRHPADHQTLLAGAHAMRPRPGHTWQDVAHLFVNAVLTSRSRSLRTQSVLPSFPPAASSDRLPTHEPPPPAQ